MASFLIFFRSSSIHLPPGLAYANSEQIIFIPSLKRIGPGRHRTFEADQVCFFLSKVMRIVNAARDILES